PVLSFAGKPVGSQCQGTGKYMSSVIICVFADQIYTAGGKISPDLSSLAVHFYEFLQKFFLHAASSLLYSYFIYFSLIRNSFQISDKNISIPLEQSCTVIHTIRRHLAGSRIQKIGVVFVISHNDPAGIRPCPGDHRPLGAYFIKNI